MAPYRSYPSMSWRRLMFQSMCRPQLSFRLPFCRSRWSIVSIRETFSAIFSSSCRDRRKVSPRKNATSFIARDTSLWKDLFPAKELDAVIAEVNQEITSRAQALLTAGKVTGTYEEQGFERQLIALDAEDSTIVPTVSSGTLAGPEIFRMICNPRLLDIAESLCGPEIIASSVYRLRAKMPGDPRGEVPWHQDSGYLDPYCDKNLILTVWVPLVDSNLESGLPLCAASCASIRGIPSSAERGGHLSRDRYGGLSARPQGSCRSRAQGWRALDDQSHAARELQEQGLGHPLEHGHSLSKRIPADQRADFTHRNRTRASRP